MNSKQEKLERIRKSCRIGQVICRIIRIICIVGAVSAIVGAVLCGVGLGRMEAGGTSPLIVGENGQPLTKEEFDAAIASDPEAAALAQGGLKDALGSMGSLGGAATLSPDSVSFSGKLVLICIFAAVMSAATAFVFVLFGQVFDALIREESPFTETVMKKLRINFIILTVVMLMMIGVFPALIAGFLFWCIYNIFDYGCVLQTESDETL